MASGVTWRKYYFAGAQRVAMRVVGDPVPANNGVFYLLGDHLGSTNLVVDEDGIEVAELRYKAWGETRYSSGSPGTDYRYTGQREEASFGLYYYRARWYDPVLGRFAQAERSCQGEGRGRGTGMRMSATIR
jgi:RHS repeat-associated protein